MAWLYSVWRTMCDCYANVYHHRDADAQDDAAHVDDEDDAAVSAAYLVVTTLFSGSLE